MAMVVGIWCGHERGDSTQFSAINTTSTSTTPPSSPQFWLLRFHGVWMGPGNLQTVCGEGWARALSNFVAKTAHASNLKSGLLLNHIPTPRPLEAATPDSMPIQCVVQAFNLWWPELMVYCPHVPSQRRRQNQLKSPPRRGRAASRNSGFLESARARVNPVSFRSRFRLGVDP